MSSVTEIYQRFCTEDRFPSADVTDHSRRLQRQQNLRTSLRYLAAAYDSSADVFDLTPDVEGTYKDRLRAFLTAQGKGYSTVRNSIQDVGQFLRICHDLPKKTSIPQARTPRLGREEARTRMNAGSPYSHYNWLRQTTYYLPISAWPEEVRKPWERYKSLKRAHLRPATVEHRLKALESYLGYLHMAPDERLAFIHPEARRKLHLKRYRDDLQTILGVPTTTAWADLFVRDHLESYVVWQAWRIHTPTDAQVDERAPGQLTAKAKIVVETMLRLAQALERKKDIATLTAYQKGLPNPRRIHNKQADCHQFTCAELEQVALTLMDEARRMVWSTNVGRVKHPGSIPARRFALGLVLMLGWRIPLRARNWVEALIDVHLRRINGVWHWHFEGDDLKVGERNGETNVYEIEIPSEVVPYLEEYLNTWRPRLHGADTDRHLLLGKHRQGGGKMGIHGFTNNIRTHVFRLTGKRLYPHLLRTLFVSHAIRNGLDPTSAAFVMNDKVATILPFYNEFYAQEHQKASQDFYRRALNGHGNGTSR